MAKTNKIAKLESKNAAAAKPAPVANPMATLTLIGVRKGGSAVYGIPGVPGTVRVARGLLAVDTAPQTLAMVNGGLFKAPDFERAAKMTDRAEKRAAAQVSREERAAKAGYAVAV